MFVGREGASTLGKNFVLKKKLSNKILIKGGLAIGVPGEIRTYKKAYDEFGGGVTWQELFAPTIRLCREGFVISTSQATAIQQSRAVILNNTALRFIFLTKE
jgi:gamma-glutamyltranspeptidase/glutathione hydrolase/leukotriene-C4 hydrolase